MLHCVVAGDSQSVESGLWLYWCGRRVYPCWCYMCSNVKHRIRWDKLLCSHDLPGTIASCFQIFLNVVSMIARLVIVFLQNCLNEIYMEVLIRVLKFACRLTDYSWDQRIRVVGQT